MSNKFEIEFWSGNKYIVESEWDDEEKVFVDYVVSNGWPGGDESTGRGIEFKAWVRKVEN